MKYDFSAKYQIKATGNPKEIKMLVEEIFNELGQKSTLYQVKDALDNLENIVKPIQHDFLRYHRISFNKNSFNYITNTTNIEASEFQFNSFKQLFDKAREKVDKK